MFRLIAPVYFVEAVAELVAGGNARGIPLTGRTSFESKVV